MTEAEWLGCEDPQRMLGLMVEKASDRKLRLFACACCRGIWGLLHRCGRNAVKVAECFADGNVDELELCGARYELERVGDNLVAAGRRSTPANRAAYAATGDKPAYWAPVAAKHAERAADATGAPAGPRQAALLRDIIGNLYSPRSIDQAWVTVDLRRLAKKLYRARRSPSGGLNGEILAMLSVALEEAGCTDESILAHLRSPGPHVRGCWVVDLLLGKG